jgi:hypothetical protein
MTPSPTALRWKGLIWKEILERKKEILAEWVRDEDEIGYGYGDEEARVVVEGNRAWIDGEMVCTLTSSGEVLAEMLDEPNTQMRIGVYDCGNFRKWVVVKLVEGKLDAYLPAPENGDASEGE